MRVVSLHSERINVNVFNGTLIINIETLAAPVQAAIDINKLISGEFNAYICFAVSFPQ